MKKFDWSDMDDVFVHATNCSVQQRHPQYDATACNKPLSVGADSSRSSALFGDALALTVVLACAANRHSQR